MQTVRFHNLPFDPVAGQVIYFEGNARIDRFVRRNHDWLVRKFAQKGLDFCFLPILGERLLAYNAPQLSQEKREGVCRQVLAHGIFQHDPFETPSLVFSITDVQTNGQDWVEMQSISINCRWFERLKSIFSARACAIADVIRQAKLSAYRDNATEKSTGQPSVTSHESDTDFPKFSISPSASELDDDLRDVVEQIKSKINILRNRGISTMFLHAIIDEQNQPLSRLLITNDFRIILPDYGNREIHMPALQKAVFLLFLRHPEGIRFKQLSEHYYELFRLYRALNPMGTTARQQRSVQNVVNPLNNSINEQCARIRDAFVTSFDESMASHYCITGKRGELKRITLDPSMVIWNCVV